MSNMLLAGWNGSDWWQIFICAFLTIVFLHPAVYRFMQSWQLSSYRYKRYLGWLGNTRGKYLLRLALTSLLGVVTLTVLNAVFGKLIGDAAGYIGLAFLCFYLFLYIRSDFKTIKKTPLAYTPRIVRLYVLYDVLVLAAGICCMLYIDIGAYYIFGILFALLPVLIPVLALLAMLLLSPFEYFNNRRYIARARKKIAGLPVKVIGITGSYGKTSVKNILYDMLSERFTVVKTPDSFNTPLGVTRTVLSDLNAGAEYFLCEMGARSPGDIRYLCDMVHPAIGVLTGIAPQHLEYFKSIENIKKTKYELIEALPAEGYAVFGGESCAELYGNCSLSKSLTGRDIAAENVEIGSSGSSFTIVSGKRRIPVNTVLLGKHSVDNVLTAAAVCIRLGLTDGEIAEGVKRIAPVKHRLELVSKAGGVTVIDDSYNSNPVSASCAIDTLQAMEGRRIIVTCGFIELGEMQNEAHRSLGKKIAAVFQKTILVGQNQTKEIRAGLVEAGYPEEDIITVRDLSGSEIVLASLLQSGDAVLFLNDLPDNYTESV